MPLLIAGQTEIWLTRHLPRRTLALQSAAHYLDCAPSQLTLSHDPFGRPLLSLDGSPISLHLSLTSSDNLSAVAFSLSSTIGVDVQHLLPSNQIDDTLLRRTLHPSERPDFDHSPNPLPLRFTACWTRKEAVLKALGTGLQFEPNTIPLPPLRLDTPQPFHLPQLNTTLRLTTWAVSPTHVLSICTPDPTTLIR